MVMLLQDFPAPVSMDTKWNQRFTGSLEILAWIAWSLADSRGSHGGIQKLLGELEGLQALTFP